MKLDERLNQIFGDEKTDAGFLEESQTGTLKEDTEPVKADQFANALSEKNNPQEVMASAHKAITKKVLLIISDFMQDIGRYSPNEIIERDILTVTHSSTMGGVDLGRFSIKLNNNFRDNEMVAIVSGNLAPRVDIEVPKASGMALRTIAESIIDDMERQFFPERFE